MIYRFNNVVFTPNEAVKLTVNGEAQKLETKPMRLLQYFLECNGEVRSKNTILDDVWGPGQHTHSALAVALSKLNKVLPPECKVQNRVNEGYVIQVKLYKVELKHQKFEALVESSPYAKRVINTSLAMLFLLSMTAVGATISYTLQWLHPSKSYQIKSLHPLFNRDYLVGTPQLSPDGDYLAHRLSTHIYKEDFLAIRDLSGGESRKLVRMKFTDGFKWNLTGDKIVYQQTSDDNCQVRLLSFNPDKTIASDKLLTQCINNGSNLSFAWFNDHEFYLNLTANDKISANGLPLHHLYSFNIDNLTTTKIKTATYQGGIGFHGLEYDPTIDALYLLKAPNFTQVDFYRYQQGQLTKLTTLDYLVPFYSVANDQLVYKNNQNQLVINQPAANFAGQQRLFTPAMTPIAEPHFNGDKITFLAGNTIQVGLRQWQNGQLTQAKLGGFTPSAMGQYNRQLVFSSNQNGSYQLYLQTADNQPRQISRFNNNEYIQHIAVHEDLFVLSYRAKVMVYRYDGQQLHLVKSLPGYHQGVIDADGTTLLLNQLQSEEQPATLIEMAMSNGITQPLDITQAKLGLYHNNQLVYLNQDAELIRLVGTNQQRIARGLKINDLSATELVGDKLYYISPHSPYNKLAMIDLNTAEQTYIDLGDINPTRVEMIDNRLLIQTWQTARPKIVIATISRP